MEHLNGRKVLVTGAGGSIGSQLVIEILKNSTPSRLSMVDLCEYNLYTCEQIAKVTAQKGTKLRYLLADVRHSSLMMRLMADEKPDFVIHAAALKHVPMLEYPHNTMEAIRTNILGTRSVLYAAEKAGAKQFLLVSTDKAVNPMSMMGATKAFAEGICEEHARGGSSMRCITVRFGNVLGSSGSVVPLFQSQIDKGGPVTVTHPQVIRYFMTISQAVRLVLTASEAALTCTETNVFVLEMGKPTSLDELARNMIYASGREVEIEYTGLRPGEKMYEELVGKDEVQLKSKVEGMIPISKTSSVKGFLTMAEKLEELCDDYERVKAVNLLRGKVPYAKEVIE